MLRSYYLATIPGTRCFKFYVTLGFRQLTISLIVLLFWKLQSSRCVYNTVLSHLSQKNDSPFGHLRYGYNIQTVTIHSPPDDWVLGLSKGFVSAKQLKKRISTFYKYMSVEYMVDNGRAGALS